jgi:prepilin-type N-terminal cleavage/methylation domain-containing protein
MKRARMIRSSGFTLVEVAIALAVIAVIIAGTFTALPELKSLKRLTVQNIQKSHKADVLTPVDRALQKLIAGFAGYVAPSALEVGSEGRVVLELSKDANKLKDDMENLLAESGSVSEQRSVQIGPEMQAQLTGAAFDIEPTTEPRPQAITGNTPTSWTWRITPLEGDDWFPKFHAKRHLTLTLYAILRIAGADRTRILKEWEPDITVEVTWSNWLHKLVEIAKDLWWLWLTIVAIIGVVIGRKVF